MCAGIHTKMMWAFKSCEIAECEQNWLDETIRGKKVSKELSDASESVSIKNLQSGSFSDR